MYCTLNKVKRPKQLCLLAAQDASIQILTAAIGSPLLSAALFPESYRDVSVAPRTSIVSHIPGQHLIPTVQCSRRHIK